jgi:hypothetical protein
MPTHLWLYADFSWRGHEESAYTPTYKDTSRIKKFPTEPEAVNKLRDCLSGAHKEALAKAPKRFREALRNFKIPPAA